MKLLLHICCGPCSIYPVEVLRDADHEIIGFFYRHNIHPFTECLKREETLKTYAESISLKVIKRSIWWRACSSLTRSRSSVLRRSTSSW